MINILFVTASESATLVNLRSVIQSRTDTQLDVMIFGMPIIKNNKIFQDTYFNDIKIQKFKKKIASKLLLKDPLLTLYKFYSDLYLFFMLLKFIKNKTYDICIAETSTIGALILIFKKIGKCKMTIFFAGDIYPMQATGIVEKFLIWIQKILRKLAYKNDVIWYIGSELKKWDKQRGFFPKDFFISGIYAFDQKKLSHYARKSKNMNKISYIGRLAQSSGLDMVIKSIKYIKKKIPNISFDVIGGYSDKDLLHYKKLAKEEGVSDRVQFHGFVKETEKIDNILAKSALGMAVYNPQEKYGVSFSEPGKVKDYLAIGTPVVITRKGPKITKTIKKHHAGLLVEYDPYDIANKVSEILLNKDKYKIVREGALSFAKNRSYEKVLPVTYRKIINSYKKFNKRHR